MSRFVVMGVSGCGKSEIGRRFAVAIGGSYVEADDLHPRANIEKMAAGIALDDADRLPWLDRAAAVLASAQPPAVLGCSALKRAYRERLRNGAGEPLKFVHLAGPRSLIATRLAARQGHFMPPGLLESQFDALEPPDEDERAITASIDRKPDEIVAHLLIAMEEDTS